MYKSIIFDLDGTLIDGREGILSSVKYMIDFCNLKPLNDDILMTFIGPPIQTSLMNIYKMSEQEAQKCVQVFRNKYKEEDIYKAKIYDGIIELLEFLNKKGYKTGVATYKRQDLSERLLKYLDLDKYFDVICGADSENKLTKADIMKNCINSLDQSIKMIMIGDSCHDAIAANNLNIPFIAAIYGFGFKNIDEVKQFNPIFVATNAQEIRSFINNFV